MSADSPPRTANDTQPGLRLSRSDGDLIAELIPHMVWMVAQDGTIAYLNRQGTEYTGLSPEAYDGCKWAWLLHPEDADGARREWRRRREPRLPSTPNIGSGGSTASSVGMRSARCRSPRRVAGGSGGSAPQPTSKMPKSRTPTWNWRTGRPRRRWPCSRRCSPRRPVGFGFVDRDFRVVRLNETLAAINGSTVAEQVGQTGRRGRSRAVAAARTAVPPGVLDSGEAVLDVEVDGTGSGRSDPHAPLVGELLPGRGGRRGHRDRHRRGRHHRTQEGRGGPPAARRHRRRVRRRHLRSDHRRHRHQLERGRGATVRLHRRGDHRSADGRARSRRPSCRAGARCGPASSPAGRRNGSRRSAAARTAASVDVLITASTATDETGTIVGLSVIAHDITGAPRGATGAGGQPAPAGRGAADRPPRELRTRSRHAGR